MRAIGLELEVVDLKEGSKYESKFFELLDSIAESYDDRVKDNYLPLKYKYKEYDAFSLVIDDEDDIVAFAGLQSDRFPEGHARVLTRLYYAEKVRWKVHHRDIGIAPRCLLPHHVAIAREKGFKKIFMSREEKLGDMRYISKIVDKVNKTFPEESWRVLDGVYNTSPFLPKVWQHIILCDLEPGEFKLEKRHD